MAPQPKTLQDIFRERRMKDMKREYYFERLRRFWTACKRLAFVGLIGYGAHQVKKNPETLKSFLKSHSVPIEQRAGRFKDGVNMIKDTFKKDNSSEVYHEQKRKHIKEYRDMGIDPVVRYAEPGTKEYREELEYYRKEGIFRARE